MLFEEIKRITKLEEILFITDIIHDCKFDKSKFLFDSGAAVLTIEFEYEQWDKKSVIRKIFFIKKVQVPIVKYILKISGVESFEIHEGRQPGPGTDDFFNKIVYDQKQKVLKIMTVIAKSIEVKVSKIDISIENHHQATGDKISLSI